MRLLLDTGVIVRFLRGELGRTSRELVQSDSGECFVSIVSLWEVALKPKLASQFGITVAVVEEFVRGYAEWVPVRLAHIRDLPALPMHHRDPFDRLMICQAKVEALAFLSMDRMFGEYEGLRVIRA